MVSKEVVRFPSKAAYRGTCFFVSEVPIQLPTFVAINEGCVCTCESLMESVWCVGHRSKQDTSSFSLTADLATPVTMQESSLVMRRGVPDLLGGRWDPGRMPSPGSVPVWGSSGSKSGEGHCMCLQRDVIPNNAHYIDHLFSRPHFHSAAMRAEPPYDTAILGGSF